MKQISITILFVLLIAACKSKVSTEDMKQGIAESFKEQSGYEVAEVELLQKEDYLYTGYVKLIDNSQAMIEVTIDKENPKHYMWQVTQPSKTMIEDAISKETEKLQHEMNKSLDSLLDE